MKLTGLSCSTPTAIAAAKKATRVGKELKMPYPESINLPFNRASLPNSFNFFQTPASCDNEEGFWVIIQGASLILEESEKGLKLPFGPYPHWACGSYDFVTFASMDGKPVMALSLPSEPTLPPGLTLEPFNAFRDRIPADLMTIGGIGKQLLHWQQSSNFCSVCSGKMTQLNESWGKKCTSCSREHYPNIHSCAIVLIKRDDQLLLIKKPEWPQGRYSLVAGFLDVGESLEECAAREAMEETGVTIKNIRYVTSQSWPFPSQMMVGFVADYAYGEIKVDGKEIEDARWFTAGHLPSLPSSRSIARFLIDSFEKGLSAER